LTPHDPDPDAIDKAFDWRAALVRWREQQRVTQAELARRSGLSLSAIKAYEGGKRRPSLVALESLIAALGIPKEEANHITAGAGFAIDWRTLFHNRYPPLTLADLEAEASACPWPAFVTNESFDVLCPNDALAWVFEADREKDLLGFGERNLLGGITHDEFASRIENWDEVVTFMCGMGKGDPRWGSGERPAPWLDRPVQRMLDGNPDLVRRFFEIWQTAPSIAPRLRQRYTVRWLHAATHLHFSCRLVLADLWSGLHWNEWVPADAETWAAF
jgi:transcriptional regulator with XRE-family HTH domain